MLAIGVGRTLGAMDLAELELRGLLERIDDVRIVGGVLAGQLDLEREVAHRADDRLGHAEGIHAQLHDLDGLVDHVSVGDLGLLGGTLAAGLGAGRVDLEGEGHAALEVEAQLETALGTDEHLLQHDAVALGLVGFADELLLGEEERTQIDAGGAPLPFRDVAQGLVIRNRLLLRGHGRVLVEPDALKRFGVELGEAIAIGDDLRRNELIEGSGSDGMELRPGHGQGDDRNRKLPEPGPGRHR